jgi:hypothetical protein
LTPFILLVAWVPLLVLSALKGGGSLASFIVDFGTWGRLLGAGPLLIAGEAACIAVLGTVARRFFEMHFVADADQPRFARAVASTLAWRDAPAVEIALALASVAISVMANQNVPAAEVPLWHRAGVEDAALSPAGWWSMLVSLPLLLVLLLDSIWRLVLWARFLLLVSRLDLNLVPVHPDKAAGIGFIGYSVRGF